MINAIVGNRPATVPVTTLVIGTLSGKSIPYNGSTTFTITPTGGNSSYTYAWYYLGNLIGNTQTIAINNATTTGSVYVVVTSGSQSINSNTVTLTVAANQAPIVNITSPSTGTSYNAPASITLTATASDQDGTITKVEFYQNSVLIATLTSSPYSYVLNNVAFGSYTYTAKAYDNFNLTTTSSPVNVSVSNASIGQGIPIPFTIDSTNTRTSAGVYDNNGNLIRTLWGGRQYTAGSHIEYWDGKIDDFTTNAANSNYNVKVLKTSAELSWRGTAFNSSSNLSGATKWHGTGPCGFEVLENNNIIVFHTYIENNYCADLTNTTNPNSKISIGSLLHGTGLRTCNDGQKAYCLSYNGSNFFVYAIDNVGNFYNFSASSSSEQGRSTLYQDNTSVSVGGIAVQKSGNNDYFFISLTSTGTIKVYNKNTGAFVRDNIIGTSGITSWLLCCDRSNGLWIGNKKYTVATDGSLTYASVSISGVVNIAQMGISTDGNKIAFIDNDPSSQQIKFYNNSTGTSISTFGQVGGYYNTNVVSNDRFCLSVPTPQAQTQTLHYICYDNNGGYWFNDCYNFRNLHFNSSNVYQEQVAWLPFAYNTILDVNDPQYIYAGYIRAKVTDLDNPQTTWTLDRCYYSQISSTVEPFESLDWVFTFSNNRIYACVRNTGDTGSTANQIIDLTDTVIRYTGVNYDWQSRVNRYGDIFTRTIYGATRQVITGFTSNNPIYSSGTNYIGFNVDPTNQPYNITYAPLLSDGTLITFDPSTANGTKQPHIGFIAHNDTKFKALVAYGTGASYQGVYPTDGFFDNGHGTNGPGGALTTDNDIIYWNHHGEFYDQGQTSFHHLVDKYGLFLGVWGTRQGSTMPQGECVPWNSGNAVKSQIVYHNNKYYICFGDESRHGGVHIASGIINNTNLVYEDIDLTKSTDYTTTYNYQRLTDGLQGIGSLPTNGIAGWTLDTPDSLFTTTIGTKTYGNQLPDIIASIHGYTNNDFSRVKSIYKTLTPSNSAWLFTGNIDFINNFANTTNNPTDFIHFYLMDSTDKAIAVFNSERVPNFNSVGANNILFSGSTLYSDTTQQALNGLHPFSITTDGSLISMTFMGNTISASIAQTGANILNPTKFQIRMVGTDSNGGFSSIDLSDLRFYPNKTIL